MTGRGAGTKSQGRITITTLAAGQPRAYADSIYRYRIEIEFDPSTTGETKTVQWTGPNLIAEACHLAWAWRRLSNPMKLGKDVLVGYPHVRTDAHDVAWHEDFIDEAIEIEPGVAEIQIRSPYCD